MNQNRQDKLRILSFLALLRSVAFVTFLTACGARTGPIVIEPNAPGTFIIEGTGQCGLCFRQQFAIARRGRGEPVNDRVCSLFSQNGATCNPVDWKIANPSGVELAQPVLIYNPQTGADETIYCALNSKYEYAEPYRDILNHPESTETNLLVEPEGLDHCNLSDVAILQFHPRDPMGNPDCDIVSWPGAGGAECYPWSDLESARDVPFTRDEYCGLGSSRIPAANSRFLCDTPTSLPVGGWSCGALGMDNGPGSSRCFASPQRTSAMHNSASSLFPMG